MFLLHLSDLCKRKFIVKQFIEKYRNRIVLMGLFVFFVHGSKLHSTVIGIDSEDIMNSGLGFYNGWVHTGRGGLVLLKYLFGNSTFNPYLAGGMTIVLFTLSVFFMLFLWERVYGGHEEKGSLAAFLVGGFLLASHPVWVEQFYFSLQSMEICVGLLITVAALFLSRRLSLREGIRDGWYALTSVLCLLLAFSLYQSFVPLFIFGAVSLLLTDTLRRLTAGERITSKEMLRQVFVYVAVFLTAFLLNQAITCFFFSPSEYLNNQIKWGSESVAKGLYRMLAHVVRVFTGYKSVFYHFSFGALCILAACLLIGKVKRSNAGKTGAGWIAFLYGSLLLTPFLMTFLMGSSPVIRSQLVLPCATAYLAWLTVMLFLEEHPLSGRIGELGISGGIVWIVTALVCITGIWSQIGRSLALYYTDACRYAEDERIGRDLINRIDVVMNGKNLPVVFLGRHEFSGNRSCVEGEMIGVSFFDHDTDEEPRFYFSSRRVIGFLHTLGRDYRLIEQDEVADYVDYWYYMPAYPQENCVQIQNNTVVVKLGPLDKECEKKEE